MSKNDFYKKGKIYKIVCNVTDNQYIGSTCKSLCQRLANHRADYKRYINGLSKNYITAFKILENNDYNIILLEYFPCDTKEELNARERYYIETLSNINKNKPTITKEEIINNGKIYREEHKEERNKYKIENREEILKYHNEYYIKNKEKLQIMMNKRINCECGKIYQAGNKSKHFKTKKHLKCIEINKQNINNIEISE
jgi:hypothetical protein